MFTLTAAEWIFCSVFTGICTVCYMIKLYETDIIERELRDEKIAQEQAKRFIDLVAKLNEEREKNNKENEEKDGDND